MKQIRIYNYMSEAFEKLRKFEWIFHWPPVRIMIWLTFVIEKLSIHMKSFFGCYSSISRGLQLDFVTSTCPMTDQSLLKSKTGDGRINQQSDETKARLRHMEKRERESAKSRSEREKKRGKIHFTICFLVHGFSWLLFRCLC